MTTTMTMTATATARTTTKRNGTWSSWKGNFFMQATEVRRKLFLGTFTETKQTNHFDPHWESRRENRLRLTFQFCLPFWAFPFSSEFDVDASRPLPLFRPGPAIGQSSYIHFLSIPGSCFTSSSFSPSSFSFFFFFFLFLFPFPFPFPFLFHFLFLFLPLPLPLPFPLSLPRLLIFYLRHS